MTRKQHKKMKEPEYKTIKQALQSGVRGSAVARLSGRSPSLVSRVKRSTSFENYIEITSHAKPSPERETVAPKTNGKEMGVWLEVVNSIALNEGMTAEQAMEYADKVVEGYRQRASQ